MQELPKGRVPGEPLLEEPLLVLPEEALVEPLDPLAVVEAPLPLLAATLPEVEVTLPEVEAADPDVLAADAVLAVAEVAGFDEVAPDELLAWVVVPLEVEVVVEADPLVDELCPVVAAAAAALDDELPPLLPHPANNTPATPQTNPITACRSVMTPLCP